MRWNADGDMLGIASNDKTSKVTDFKNEKMIYSGITSDSSNKYFVHAFVLNRY